MYPIVSLNETRSWRSLVGLPKGNLPEGVDLAEPLLVGQRGDVVAEALEGVVDALHPLALPHVGRVPLLDLNERER